MRTLIVTALSDEQKYKEQCLAFLESIEQNATGEAVRVVACEDSLDFVKAVRGAYAFVDAFTVGKVRHEDQRGYMVCLRGDLIATALEEPYDAVAWMDVDCLVRKTLRSFWDDAKPDTLRCIYRPKKKTNRRFQAGVVGFGNGTYMREMVGKWRKEIAEDIRWYKDQESLYELWALYQDDITLVPLKRKHNDSTFQEDSVIWHSKEHHFEEEAFQKEYQEYLKLAKERTGWGR